jgi:triosephosphate isomerase
MANRIPLIAGNWKMYKTTTEAVDMARQLVELTAAVENVDIMIAPIYIALDAVSQVVSGSKVSLGV